MTGRATHPSGPLSPRSGAAVDRVEIERNGVESGADRVVGEVRAGLADLGRSYTPLDVARILHDLGHPVTDALVRATLEALRRDSLGAGPLDDLLHEDGVTDIVVNGPRQVFVDRGAGLEPAGVRFADDAEVRRLAMRLAAGVGRRLDEGSPYVDARLPDGTRVHAILGSLATPGTCLSLRRPARRRLRLDDLVAAGSIPPAGADLLRQLVARRLAFLVSGGTGSGKTTILGALLACVDPAERLVIIEDSRELDPDHPHVVRLEARHANAEGAGAVTLTDLVRQSLRMRPDRVVLGEVRGGELSDLLTALNTGHEGGCGTVHANSAAAVPARLEALGALGGLGRTALHAQVAAALDVVIHLGRDAAGRRVVKELHMLVPDPLSGLVCSIPAVTFEAGRTAVGPAGPDLERRLDR
ncbi:TadA family conjugal transfer-associated ATPase [Propionicicella superfundia]|uniref:TadA family conjugal transfer-associated ATPase n=1 Tax=Propionicicella superfundia TaxID=348582 RepID=UPI000400F795|nr:TadA family conjugal transfer-associated ATPase [Propionicicella superfundia]